MTRRTRNLLASVGKNHWVENNSLVRRVPGGHAWRAVHRARAWAHSTSQDLRTGSEDTCTSPGALLPCWRCLNNLQKTGKGRKREEGRREEKVKVFQIRLTKLLFLFIKTSISLVQELDRKRKALEC